MPSLLVQNAGYTVLVEQVLTGQNPNTKQAYRREILAFLDWLKLSQQSPDLTSVLAYKDFLVNEKKSAAAINQKLSAIRFFFRSAATLGYLTTEQAEKLSSVSAVKTRGRRIGNWLEKSELETLLQAPHESQFSGSALPYRDQAILATLGGAGLRRSEVASLKHSQIVFRDSRWILADIEGKGGVIRSVPIAAWIKSILDQWLSLASITTGHVFRQCSWKVGESTTLLDLPDLPLSDESIRNVVLRYSKAIGKTITAHDLRRSFARLARRNGCPLEQIQLSLGHHSINTTQIYIGNEQDFKNAPSDFLHLEIKQPGN